MIFTPASITGIPRHWQSAGRAFLSAAAPVAGPAGLGVENRHDRRNRRGHLLRLSFADKPLDCSEANADPNAFRGFVAFTTEEVQLSLAKFVDAEAVTLGVTHLPPLASSTICLQLHILHPLRLKRMGRHVGGRQDTIQDVLSPAAQRRGRVQVHSLETEEGCGGWRELTLADRRASIPDLAAFRIDFARWLRTLTRRDRRIIAALVSGEKAKVVGRRLGITEGRVSQIRHRYQREWAVFQGEVAGRAA